MACSGTGKGEIVWAIHRALFIRARYKGLGAKRLWRVFRILRSSFKKVAVSETNENKKTQGQGRCFFCKAGISLDLFVVLFSFFLTSIAAYGVTPHIKSVSTVTGQDRPRPRFPAGPMRKAKISIEFKNGKKKKSRHPCFTYSLLVSKLTD